MYWYVRADYESNTLASLRNYLRPGMVCMDIGANAGFYTLLMARRVGQGGRVYAFEPTATTFCWLGQNIALNKLENVVAENVAVTDQAGTVEFRVGPPELTVYNSISEVSHPGAKAGRFERVFVPTISIDDYCARKKIDRVDCVKIDVEGAEFQVLKGMRRTLESNRDIVLLVEFGQTTAAACGTTIESMAEWLTGMGFRLFRIGANGRLHPATGTPLKDGEMVWVARSAIS
jgi:FkbM family methyltransferase